ncbi:MAG: type II toxin-antitoxin system Phd/YefM family antitoxin [Thermomicrobiales bacterium]|nr:type II toxin-antitoxin system Phd/YefM family antitoxin [Thermomicrobiales bacterium]
MKTVSATEAKNRLGALIGDVAGGEGDVIIENHGRPRAVLISYDTYQELLDAREKQRRQEALAALRALREQVRARNQDLDEAAADALIEEIGAELRARLSARLRTDATRRTG